MRDAARGGEADPDNWMVIRSDGETVGFKSEANACVILIAGRHMQSLDEPIATFWKASSYRCPRRSCTVSPA